MSYQKQDFISAKTFLNKDQWNKMESIKKMCRTKIKYDSELEADSYGKLYNYQHNENLPYRSYFCKHCLKWHLTTSKKKTLST